MPRFHHEILLIVGHLFICFGCVGTRTLDLTRPGSVATEQEIGESVLGDAVTVTYIDGTMYEGDVIGHTDSSLALSSNETTDGRPIPWQSIHELSISGRPLFLIAGAMGGGLAGGLVGSWLDPPTSEPVDPGGARVGAVVGGVAGGILIGGLGAERRYIIKLLNESRDTLSVSEADILVETGKRITIRRHGIPVTYDRSAVSWKKQENRCLLIVPGK
jgi:hypothetical protein